MTEQTGENILPDATNSGEDQINIEDKARDYPNNGNVDVSGDENNNKDSTRICTISEEMAVTYDNGLEQHRQSSGFENVQLVGENITTKIENLNVHENTEFEIGHKFNIRMEIQDKEAVDIDQFDSVSNVVSQHGNEEVKKSNTKQEELKSIHVSDTTMPRTNHSQQLIQDTASEQSHKGKKIKKSVFVSYSPDAGFIERKFVVETIKQLKENNLAEDIWFDKDENNTGSACWFSMRMEAVEKCRAAILFLSDNYYLCPVSIYECKTLLERIKSNPNSVAIFPILFSEIEKSKPHNDFIPMMKQAVNLTREHAKLSLAEKTSVVIGTIMESLEKFACMNLPLQVSSVETEFTGKYTKKKICQWDVQDLQEWLFKLGIKEFYRQSLAENTVDGFLLLSLTDQDMINYLGIDSRVVRKKIIQNILSTLDKENKMTDNWHLKARAQRAQPDVIYLVYDPADVRLAQNLKNDLRKKRLQVIHHDSIKLGRSKEEFLEINGTQMASATYVIIIVTEAAKSSPFVFHEVLFADWLGRKLVSAVFQNIWSTLRPSLKAVLGECPAIDFETKMYAESLDVLENHVKPLRRIPGVVLEQTYLNKMTEGVKPFQALASSKSGMQNVCVGEGYPKVFISYQWDMQAKVEDIKQILETNGLICWADINMAPQPNRTNSSKSGRNSATTQDGGTDTLQSILQRNMKASSVVLICITPKYLQSDNCKKDLMLAETFNKPVIPVLLRYSPFESAPDPIRKILARLRCIDLSNDRLYKQNIELVVDKIKKLVTQ